MITKIKTTIRAGVVSLALVFTIPTTNAAVGAFHHVTLPLLNNATLVCITNGQTAGLGTSNYWYYGYPYGTNILAGSTNAVGIFWPSPFCSAPLFPDGNGDVNPTFALQIGVGFTNLLQGAPKQTPSIPSLVWTNPSSVFTNSATAIEATNSTVFTLVGIASGDWSYPDSGPNMRSWSFTVVTSNSLPVIVTTNVPISFLQGLYSVALTVTPTLSGGTGQGIVLDFANLTGWSP